MTDTFRGILANIGSVLRPTLATNSLHDQGEGQPQARDRAELTAEAAEHPALPAAGISQSEADAGAALDASIAEARARVGL